MTSPFNGDWRLDQSRSKQWDYQRECWIPDQLDREDIRIYIEGKTYDWDLWAGIDPEWNLTHSGVIDGDWAPYLCRAFKISDAARERLASRPAGVPQEASRLNLGPVKAGKPTAFIKLVQINERLIYRISRNPDHVSPNYALMTQVTANDELEGYLMNPEGRVVFYRIATRVG